MEQKFSVVLYVWQKDFPTWVKQALDSVFSNTVKPAEVVIMVDGPVNEDLQAVIDEAAKNETVRVLSHPVPMLRAAALAFAIKQCKYDLIAIQGADSISLPNRFEKQLAYFTENPETAVLGGYAQKMDRNNEALSTAIREVPESEQEIKTFLKNHSPFIYRTVMFKKQAILDAGNYKDFPNLEDEYLWVRVIGKGYTTANLTSVIANIHSIDAYEHMVLALPHFQMKRELFSTMRQMGMIGSFTYYRLVCMAFIKYLIIPNWFRRKFHLYDIQA